MINLSLVIQVSKVIKVEEPSFKLQISKENEGKPQHLAMRGIQWPGTPNVISMTKYILQR